MTTADDPERFRVLFVEDDERLAAMTARYLETHGLLVDRVADGRTGARRRLRR